MAETAPPAIQAIQDVERKVALLLIKIAEVDKLLGRASLSAGNRARLTEKQQTFRSNLEQEQLLLTQLRQKLVAPSANRPAAQPIDSVPAEAEPAPQVEETLAEEIPVEETPAPPEEDSAPADEPAPFPLEEVGKAGLGENPLRSLVDTPRRPPQGGTLGASPPEAQELDSSGWDVGSEEDSLQVQLYRSHRHREALLEWLVDLRDKVVTGVKESSRFQYLFEQSQAEALHLHQRVVELEQRQTTLQKDYQHLEQALAEEGRARQEIESHHEQLRAANLALEERGRRVSMERQQLRRAYEELEAELKGANARLAELERRLAQEESQRQALRPRIEVLEREKSELLTSLSALTIEKNSWPERGDLEQKLLHLEQERIRLSESVEEVENRLTLAQADSDTLRLRLAESEMQTSELVAKLAVSGKPKKKGETRGSLPDLEQMLHAAEKERAELERVAVMAERDRSNLAARLGRLEQELVDRHTELDRETRLRQQLSLELSDFRAAAAAREEEKAAGAARTEQLEDLLLLTEKELFQRQQQYNEELAKVESMADSFRQNRIDRENLETRIQLLSRDKAESHRLIREQERQIRLLKHDLEFFKPDRLVDSAEIRVVDAPGDPHPF